MSHGSVTWRSSLSLEEVVGGGDMDGGVGGVIVTRIPLSVSSFCLSSKT